MILQMVQFYLESSRNCKKDSLKMFEGSISNSSLMSTRCGNDRTRYISQSNIIHLVYSQKFEHEDEMKMNEIFLVT